MNANLAHLFERALAAPGRALYRHWTGEGWKDVTAAEVAALAARWQAAFRREGYAPGDRVALAVRNGVQWVAIDQAALGLGLVVVPLYVDDNADNLAWCVAHAEARLLVVEGTRMAEALRALAGQYALPPVVVLRPDASETGTTADRWLPEADRPFEARVSRELTVATHEQPGLSRVGVLNQLPNQRVERHPSTASRNIRPPIAARRAVKVSPVSSGAIGVRSCNTTSPASISSVSRMTVTPVSTSPLMIAD